MVDIELGDDLLKQVETMAQYDTTAPNTKRQIKFDDRGTLHLMHRDVEGKLLKDLPIKEEYKFPESEYMEIKQECDALRQQSNTANKIFYGALIGLGILMIATIIMLNTLSKGGF